MKMVFLSFYEGKTDEVIAILKSEKIESYVRWDEVKGQAAGFRPRMGTDVWPGHNGALQFPIEDGRVDRLFELISHVNQAAEYEGISAFVFDLTRMLVKEPKQRS